MDVEIRAVGSGEEERLLPMYEWLFEPPGRTPPQWDPGRAAVALRQAIESHDAVVLVAEAGQVEVGICVAYQDIHSVRFGFRAWVEDLAVHPDHRSAGFGKALLDAAKDWGREHGASHLELDSGQTRTEAHRFYEREQPSWQSISYGWEL
jgi:GNAT superfamily N-acetyltransferase